MRMHTPKALKSTSLRLFEKSRLLGHQSDCQGVLRSKMLQGETNVNSIKASGSKVPMLNPSPIPISCAEITLDVLSFAASGKVRILMAMRFELIKCSALAILPLVWRTDFGAKSYRHGAK